MLSRVRGINDRVGHYGGLPIMEKNEFYEWSLGDATYNTLYAEWVRSGYVRRLCPSINIKDPAVGYVLPNVEWVTTYINTTRALEGRTWRPYTRL